MGQLDFFNGVKILDFGSGKGETSNFFAKKNVVIAIEPSLEMLAERVEENKYLQIIGNLEELKNIDSNSMDVILCHNVLEYAQEREEIINAFYRILKPLGILSIVKHNRAGRIMQMVVLLNNFEHANSLLDKNNGSSAQFGAINYYEDENISDWNNGFKLINSYGLRTFYDLQQNQEIQQNPQWQSEMLKIEQRVSSLEEFKAIAFFHHLIFKKFM